MTQWLGLQRAFPEPWTALYSLRATCPTDTLSHYSQLLLTPLCMPSAKHITYSHCPLSMTKEELADLPSSLSYSTTSHPASASQP